MQDYWRMLREQWDRLTTAQKWGVGGLSVAVLAGLFSMVLFTDRTAYTDLARGLSLDEAAVVKKQLDSLGVPYKILDGGSGFSVASSRKDEVVLQLAGSNSLPKGSKGFFDVFGAPNPLNQSQALLDENILLARQGEIEKTIASMADVKSVRVHISKPPDKLFSEDEKPQQVAVKLELNPGSRLSPLQVKAIRNMVRNSTSTTDENISIVNERAEDLTALIVDDATGVGASATQLDLQAKRSKEIQQGIQRTLDAVLGNDRSRVMVSAELAFDEVEEDRKELAPPVAGEEKGVAVASKSVQETYEGQTPLSGGQPGVESNVPPTYPGAKKGATKYTKVETEDNIDYNETKTHRRHAVGSSIKRLSISAVLDETAVPESGLEAYRKMIAAAASFDEKRGDLLSVQRVPFNRNDQTAATERERRERLQEMIAKIAIVATPVLLLLVIFVVLWRRWESKVEELEPDVLDLNEIRETAREEQPEELSPELRARQEKIAQVRKLANADPDSIARLLQLWLVEE